MLASFLRGLFENGSIEIGTDLDGVISVDSQDPDVIAILEDRSATIAATLPPPTPPVDIDVASWAARVFYLATFVYVNREVDVKIVEESIAEQPHSNDPNAAAFGAELIFAFAPDLLRMARATASADPLVKVLVDMLGEWPLSSVGVNGSETKDGDEMSFFDHPALRALYIDRIIARKDISRLERPEVKQAVRAAVGNYPELAPELARAIDAPKVGGESHADDRNGT